MTNSTTRRNCYICGSKTELRLVKHLVFRQVTFTVCKSCYNREQEKQKKTVAD